MLWLALAGLVLLAAASCLPPVPLCPIRALAGVECPTCGTTRSVWSLLHGRFAEAWRMNPLGYLAVFILFRELAVAAVKRARGNRLDCSFVDKALLGAWFVLGGLRYLAR